MRDILSANLTEFAKRLRESMPVGGRAASKGLGRALAGVAKGVASAAGAAVEKQMEERVRSFVDDAIGVALDTTIDRFCGPAHQADMAQWRVDVLHALLQQPVERIVAERHKVPSELVAAHFVATMRTFAEWKQLPEAIEEAIEGLLPRDGDPETTRLWLAGSGLETEGRGRRPSARSRRRERVRSDARVCQLAGRARRHLSPLPGRIRPWSRPNRAAQF